MKKARQKPEMGGRSRPELMSHAAKSLGLLNRRKKNGKELVTNFGSRVELMR